VVHFTEIDDGATLNPVLLSPLPRWRSGEKVLHPRSNTGTGRTVLPNQGTIIPVPCSRINPVPPPRRFSMVPSFSEARGEKDLSLSAPKPFSSLPVGRMRIGKVPTCGHQSVSWINRNLTPSSVSHNHTETVALPPSHTRVGRAGGVGR